MKKIAVLLLFFAIFLSGCKATEITEDNRAALDFTVVNREGIPPELQSIISERKSEEFSMTYSIDGYLYIAVGYGEKSTGGYSIRVDEVYETDSNIGINTTLVGPAAGEPVNKMATYPYVVVKLEYIDKNVVFE